MVIYIVMAVKQEQPLNNGQTLPLCWADGQIGALAVFAHIKDAKKYAGRKYTVYACETMERKNRKQKGG